MRKNSSFVLGFRNVAAKARHIQNRREDKSLWPKTRKGTQETQGTEQGSGRPEQGAGRMQTNGRTTIKSLAERMVSHRVPAGPGSSSKPPRLPSTGVPAREYLLRPVASRSVASSSVASPSVASPSVASSNVASPSVTSKCVCRSASPVQPSPRLVLAHVFACLEAAAAKSIVSRLLGRSARQSSASPVSRASVRRVPCSSLRLFVPPNASVSASVSQSVVSQRASVDGFVSRRHLH
jgi:hypothetical protein